MKYRIILLIPIVVVLASLPACSLLDSTVSGVSNVMGITDTATVIAKTAQIRTSYAVVAADLLEVKRGERLDVLDTMEHEKVIWYYVRAHDEENTSGWIEAQNVITNEVLEKSKSVAGSFANLPPQAQSFLQMLGGCFDVAGFP